MTDSKDSICTDASKLLVTKHNKLIQLKMQDKTARLLPVDQKLVMAVVAQISPEDGEFHQYSMSLAELQEITGVGKNKISAAVDQSTTRLMKNIISVELLDGSWIKTAWFSGVMYNAPEGKVLFRFSPELQQYLIGLKENFTTYRLKNVRGLSSGYAIRMYELLRQFLPLAGESKVGFRQMRISDLREYLGVGDKHIPHASFRRYVIEPIQKELAKKTDIAFEFKAIKKGRYYYFINLTITKNHQFDPVNDDPAIEGDYIPAALTPLSPEMVTSIKMFVSPDIPENTMLQLGMYEDVVLRGALTAYMKTGRARDPLALFLHIVKATDQEYQAVIAKTGRSDDYDPWDTSWADKYHFDLDA